MGRSGTSSLASCLSSGSMGFSCAQEPYILSSGMYKNSKNEIADTFRSNFCKEIGSNENQVKINEEEKIYKSLDFLYENFQGVKHVYSNQIDFMNFHILKYCNERSINIIHLYRENILECAISNMLISQTGVSGNSKENKNIIKNFKFKEIDMIKLDKTINRLSQKLKNNKEIIKSITDDNYYEINKELLYSSTYKKRQSEFKKICKYLNIEFEELDLEFIKNNMFKNDALYSRQSVYASIPNYKQLLNFQNEKFIL
jgi:hypothetical protein